MFRQLKALVVFLFIFVLLAGAAAAADTQAKYIFLFIGDGMSLPQRSLAEFYLAAKNSPKDLTLAVSRAGGKFPRNNGVTDFKPARQPLLMNTFPAQGMASTYSTNAIIPDSSSAGTAMAAGHKIQDGMIGINPTETEFYDSMAIMARDKGMKVGIISTVSLEHATPAAFYANALRRSHYYEISRQLSGTRFNYFGGGWFRQPQGQKGDQKDIAERLREAGYAVYNTREDFDRIKPGDDKVFTVNPVLDSEAALPYAIDRKEGEITLAEFVAKGIEVLYNPNGFFMMAEGGKIDWACHVNDAATMIHDVIDLDEAVKVAYDFYKKHPDETLIIVTGDHETGGLSIGFRSTARGTSYDLFLKKLDHQKGSYIKFNEEFAAFKKANPNAKLDDVLPLVESFFGLKCYDKETMEKLNAEAKGNAAAYEALGMALTEHEMARLAAAFEMSMMEPKQRPATDEYYLAYGRSRHEPMTITLTRILNEKAGIGWTTFSHTGLPVPVSAIGVGHQKFNGYYDNTDIFKKIVALGGLL